jgi:hypothetical protein
MIDLAEAIQQLRAQLVKAVEEGEGEELRFGLEAIELELQVAVTKEAGGKAGFKLCVFNAEGEGKVARESLQKVKLVLKPEDKEGRKTMVSGSGPRPV